MRIRLKPLAGQVIVITGASSGIGLVTARAAAARGAQVVLVARGAAALEAAVRDIAATGGTAAAFVADVGDAAQVEAAAAFAVERFGRIDTWVSNAGVAIYAKLLETPADAHERLFRTNYFGVVHSAEAAVPRLAAGGALIVVASIAADIASPIMGAYAATKHAVKAYVGALRTELRTAGQPISITLVKPSGTDTPIGQHALNVAPGEAQIPPPVYDPALVAAVILDSAERPRREITVGGGGRAQALFAEHFPRVVEWLAPTRAQSLTDPDTPQPRPSNLFAPVRGGRARSGKLSARRTSLYTAAHLHPKTTAALALAGLAAGAAIWVARRPRRIERLRRGWRRDAQA